MPVHTSFRDHLEFLTGVEISPGKIAGQRKQHTVKKSFPLGRK